MTKPHDILIIGAGAVGLSVAYALSRQRPDLSLAIVEKESAESRHQTGHNSGVIHSGIYYTPGSLKAQNCINGYRMLLEFAGEHGIPHEICGKLIVATHEGEVPMLQSIFDKGVKNGLEGLRMISPEEARETEPHINVHKAIRVPQAGIIHFADVAAKLRSLLEAAGCRFYFNAPVVKIVRNSGEITVVTKNETVKTKFLVSCAGLYADRMAELAGVNPECKIVPFRGEYYVLKKERQNLINNLVYPVPDPAFPFLGVHFTRMIRGGIEAGPNAVLAFRREGYSKWDIGPTELLETLSYPGFRKLAAKYWRTGFGEMYRSYNKKAFVRALNKLLPEIVSGDLDPGGAGVRAQALRTDGSLVEDFLFREAEGMIHVLNAPSPAATSSLSIGRTIAEKTLLRFDQ